MSIAKKLQEKLDEVYDENIFEDSNLKKCKAICAAFLIGAIDAAVITAPFMLIRLIMLRK